MRTTDIQSLPLNTLLSPFLAIIRSPLSTGPITSAALTALHNFFVCGIIYPDAVSLQSCLGELSVALSSCKFEASDSSGDEVVLLKIMTVIHDAMCGNVGLTLGDIEICEMLETVLTTSCQMRLSGMCVDYNPVRGLRTERTLPEILRRSAEGTLHQLVRTVFARLHEFDPEAEEHKLADNGDLEGGEMKMSMSTSTSQQHQAPRSPGEEQDVHAAQQPAEPHAETEEPPPETPTLPRLPCKFRTAYKGTQLNLMCRWSPFYSGAVACTHQHT